MMVVANVFPKLQAVENSVRQFSKKGRFKKPFVSQHVKPSSILKKYALGHFYHVFSSLWGKLIRKISPLVIREVLGIFVNILTADDKYLIQDCENLQFPIEMQLSEK